MDLYGKQTHDINTFKTILELGDQKDAMAFAQYIGLVKKYDFPISTITM